MSVLTLISIWEGMAPPPVTLLPPGERAIASALPEWKRAEFVRGRLTGRAAVAMAFPYWRHGLEIRRAADGSPLPVTRCAARPSLSLSHTATLGAASVGHPGVPVGVDVEIRDERRNAPLRRLVIAAGEQLPDGMSISTAFSCKEAAYKACHGDPASLRRYHLDHEWDGLVVRPERADIPLLRVWPMDLGDALAVTVTAETRPPEVRVVHALDLIARALSDGERM